MVALIGWEEKTPPTVRQGDEVCFARHLLIRDEVLARQFSANWESFGKPVMLMVYGEVVKDPELIDDSTRPTTWKVSIEVHSSVALHPAGLTTEIQFGDPPPESQLCGPIVEFEFKFDEALTVVRHDGTPV